MEGGGICCSSHVNKNKGAAKKAPVIKGIHISLICAFTINDFPMLFTMPDEKIKLTDNTAPMSSVVFLPSIKLKTKPHTMPKGKPFKKRNTIFQGALVTANSNKANHANKISFTIVAALFSGCKEEIKRIP